MNFAEAKKALGGMINWQRALNTMQEVLEAAEQANNLANEAEARIEAMKKAIPIVETNLNRLNAEKAGLEHEIATKRLAAETVMEQELSAKKIELEQDLENFKAKIDAEKDKLNKKMAELNAKIKAKEEQAAQAEKAAADADGKLASISQKMDEARRFLSAAN